MESDMPTKDDRVHLRIEESIKDEAKAVAKLQGLNLSSLVNHLLAEAINKEKSERPDLLADALRKIKEPERKAQVAVTADANVVDAGKPQPARKPTRQRKLAHKR